MYFFSNFSFFLGVVGMSVLVFLESMVFEVGSDRSYQVLRVAAGAWLVGISISCASRIYV